MITAIHDSVYAVVGQLIGHHHTTITQDATVHVKLDLIADILRLERTLLLDKTRLCFSVFETQVLQVAFSSLVANRTVERVVDQQELGNRFPRFEHTLRRDARHFHSVHYASYTRCHRFRHRCWVGVASFGDFNEAATAFSATPLEFAVVAHGWRNRLAAYHTRRLKDCGPRFDFDALAVYCYFHCSSVKGPRLAPADCKLYTSCFVTRCLTFSKGSSTK